MVYYANVDLTLGVRFHTNLYVTRYVTGGGGTSCVFRVGYLGRDRRPTNDIYQRWEKISNQSRI